MKLTVAAYTGLGPGPHDVAVTGIELLKSKMGGQYLQWEFTDAEGKTTKANSAAEITPGNKTGKWYQAVTGKTITVGQDVDIEDVIGCAASIFIEEQPDGFGKVISVQGRTRSAKAAQPVAEQVYAAEQPVQPAAVGPTVKDDLPF